MPKFKTSDGLSLHYTDTGATTGVPVLCLSGLTRNGRDFEYAADALIGTRMITLDYRGRGQSDWAEDYTTYNVVRESQDVLELLDHLNLQKVAILGTSRGGLVAMTLAVMAPTRLLGVCFVDVGPVLEIAGLDLILGFLGRNPMWRTHDEATAAFNTRIPGFENVPEGRWRQEVETHFIQTDTGLTINYDPKLRDATLDAMPDSPPDLWPLFEALPEVPLATLRGANSDLFSAQTLQDMLSRRPDMIAATVPDRGHVPFLDEDISVSTLRDWIAQIA